MASKDAFWAEVVALAEQLLEFVRKVPPKEQMALPGPQVHILGFFWRSLRLYDGVLVLLKSELPEEAAFLARSLFQNSLRLQQLAAEPQNRDALILGWVNRSIDDKRGLMEVAKQIGLDSDIAEVLSVLDKERRNLQEYARRHNILRLKTFQPVRDAALRFSRKDDYWTYEWAHESVHGTDAAWFFARRKVAEDSAALHAKTNDPVLRAAFAQFSARSIVDAAEATSVIFGWPMPPELRRTAADIDRALERNGQTSGSS